jgi:xanthine dehydrogenase YagS FAD-binding subunit
MQPFTYTRADSAEGAVRATATTAMPPTEAPAQFLAGGTTIIDLMKLDVMHPAGLVDLNRLPRERYAAISAGPEGLRFGALVRMAEAADHEAVQRDYPVIADALELAASQQIRNMASLAGNLLQRTRCSYFRDTSWAECNKRKPGSGCAAMEGVNRRHAVLGTTDACIATYAGDLAQALIALDAAVETVGPAGPRTLALADLHLRPERPNVETALAPGELIVAIRVPAGAWTRRSLYLKIRDRESYEFALASAAVALDLDGGMVREARIALGGVATVPWRARPAESLLRGRRLDRAAAEAAADAAFADARTRNDNAYKVPLGKRTLVRALLQAATMEG